MNPHKLIAALGRAFDEASRHDARSIQALETLLEDGIAPRVRQAGFAVECLDPGTLVVSLDGGHKVRLTLEVEKDRS